MTRKHTDPGPLDLNVLYADFLLKNRPELEIECKEEVERFKNALAERATRLTIAANTGEQLPCGGKVNRLSRELFYAAFKLEQQQGR